MFVELKGFLQASGQAGRESRPAEGAFWVVLGMAFLAGLVTLGRYLALEGMHPNQVLFFRNLFCVTLMLPMLIARGVDLVRTQNLKLYGARVVLSFISMMGMFHAVALIPIGEVTAIGFLSPVLGTVFAVVLLGEVVRVPRIVALFVGFVGAMIVLRPSSGGIGAGQIAALVSVVALALIGPLVKKMTLKDDADRIVFLTNALLLPLSLFPAIAVWQWPAEVQWPFLVGLGACALFGHMCLVRAYASTEASLVMTFKFVRLPFAVILGYLAFGESIDGWMWFGALVIFAASAFITHRESRAGKPLSARVDGPPA